MTTCVATLHIVYCVVSFARTVNTPFALNRSFYLRRRALNSDAGEGLVLVMDVIADRLIDLAWGSNRSNGPHRPHRGPFRLSD